MKQAMTVGDLVEEYDRVHERLNAIDDEILCLVNHPACQMISYVNRVSELEDLREQLRVEEAIMYLNLSRVLVAVACEKHREMILDYFLKRRRLQDAKELYRMNYYYLSHLFAEVRRIEIPKI